MENRILLTCWRVIGFQRNSQTQTLRVGGQWSNGSADSAPVEARLISSQSLQPCLTSIWMQLVRRGLEQLSMPQSVSAPAEMSNNPNKCTFGAFHWCICISWGEMSQMSFKWWKFKIMLFIELKSADWGGIVPFIWILSVLLSPTGQEKTLLPASLSKITSTSTSFVCNLSEHYHGNIFSQLH